MIEKKENKNNLREKDIINAIRDYGEFEKVLKRIRDLDIEKKDQDELIRIEAALLKEKKLQDKKRYECRNDVVINIFNKYKKLSKIDLNNLNSVGSVKEIFSITEDLMNTVKTLSSVEKNIRIIHFVETTDLLHIYDENIIDHYEGLVNLLELESEENELHNYQSLFYSCVSMAISMFQQIMIDEQMFFEAFGFPNFEELEKHILEVFSIKEI